MFLQVALVPILLVVPFEDTQKRFSLELPTGWVFAPQPGEVSGASFQRTMAEARARFSAQVISVGEETTVKDFIRKVSGGFMSQPGVSLEGEEHVRVAGLSMIKRRYTRPGAGGSAPAMVEDYYGVAGGKGYLVHMEAPLDRFGTFAPDFQKLLEGLRFQDVDPMAPHPHPPTLVGKWHMEGTGGGGSERTILALRADGTFLLDDVPGVWRVNGNTMLMRPLGGSAETFGWVLQADTLQLQNPNIGGAINYYRVGEGASAPTKPLTGSWKADKHNLQLLADGRLVLNKEVGTYTAADGRITMRLGKKKRPSVVAFHLNGDELTLSEGTFGAGVVFRREVAAPASQNPSTPPSPTAGKDSSGHGAHAH